MSDLPDGWVLTRIADVADVRLGRQRSPKTHSGPNMRPYIRAANVTWNGLDLSDVKEMHFSGAEVETFRLLPGDVVLAEASGSRDEVGKPAMWRSEIVDCCFQNTLLRVRAQAALPEFLLRFFRAEALAGRLGAAARGVGIHHLGAAGLSQYPIALPPLEEQRRIVDAMEQEVSRLDAAVAALESASARARQLRRAIDEYAFSGRLVSQDPSAEPASALLSQSQTVGTPSSKRAARASRGAADA